MKCTKPYYYKQKTVKSIVFIKYTKLYCRKISFFFTKTIMLISTTRILTELRLKLLCLESDKMKKKDCMREKKRENRMISRRSKVQNKKRKKRS